MGSPVDPNIDHVRPRFSLWRRFPAYSALLWTEREEHPPREPGTCRSRRR